MTRQFKTPDYEATLNLTITLREVLPLNHLARFVVDVITQLDLSRIYARYAPVGGVPIAPEILLGLLFYGYATGVFSSRKIERATHESIPFRYIASGLHPDHDTIANFRKVFLAEIQELFVQSLLLAQEAGVFKLGNISLDGSKIHADASKHHAVSYKRLIELDTQLRQEVQALLTLGEQADQGERALPEELVIEDELILRQERLPISPRRKRCWKRAPRNATPSSKPSMRPNCASAKSRLGKTGVNRADGRRNPRRRDRTITINTTLPTTTRAS